MMDDLISRTALLELFVWKCSGECCGCEYEEKEKPYYCKLIKSAPAVDAKPIVHARWVKMTGMMPPEYHGHYQCSNCGWHMQGLRNSWTREEELLYCPNCGAKMENENK